MVKRPKVRVTVDDYGRAGTLFIDDMDLSKHVNGLDIVLEAGKPSQVRISIFCEVEYTQTQVNQA